MIHPIIVVCHSHKQSIEVSRARDVYTTWPGRSLAGMRGTLIEVVNDNPAWTPEEKARWDDYILNTVLLRVTDGGDMTFISLTPPAE